MTDVEVILSHKIRSKFIQQYRFVYVCPSIYTCIAVSRLMWHLELFHILQNYQKR